MFATQRLNTVFQNAKKLKIGDSSKIIIFSDCHRGDYGWSDDFAKNRNIFYYALSFYFNEGYTYIELGDGDELWKNRFFSEIFVAHQQVFELMSRFYMQDRFHMVYGNHDVERSIPSVVKNTLYAYYDENIQQKRPLFPDIQPVGGIRLCYTPQDRDIFLVHGHQGDLVSDILWPFGRLMVRLMWRNLQLFGFSDPTSAAKNFTKAVRVDKRLINWSLQQKKMIIAGHTHRPRYPTTAQPPYFNTGSVVSPHCITGIEIRHGQIALVRWCVKPDFSGSLRIVRDIMQGPQPLDAWGY
ncbi:MAG: serine/threonine protein phosphatase [Anaerolineaceae bacterium]|nr:serine/threonine protein phosphatase [Anaerolineaceae bacterium]